MVSKSKLKFDVGIITALPEVELPAVLKAFEIDPNREEDRIIDGYRYWHTSIESSKLQNKITIVITSIGVSGNITSNEATLALIKYYNPSLLLFIGIAAGLKDKVELLDTVISDRVIGYESVKLTDNGVRPRPQIEHPPHKILQDVHFFNQQVQDDKWSSLFKKLQNSLTSKFLPPYPINRMPIMHIGSIASGEKLLADGSLEEIRLRYDDRILAGEMEGIGFAIASVKSQVPWLIIRGISDFGDPLTKDGRLKDRFHHSAANSAASWARVFLEFSYSGPTFARGNMLSEEEDDEIRLCNRIIEKIQNLVAIHGLDDNNWAKAISSQYFLVGLAKILELTDQRDYLNLLNRFLGSFHYNIKGELILDKEHMLITPQETERIVQFMKDEDEKDDFYKKSAKTKAENINANLMHNNYHYGLTLRITSSEKIQVMDNIRKFSIERLTIGESLDDYGGWYPYRIPWITARILISFKDADVSESDKEGINIIIQRGLISLIRRIYQGKYWRSGVGVWVSKWESTALCLEALDRWDFIKQNKSKIIPILKYIIENQNEWMIDPPRFSNEEDSNKTLSSIVMTSVLLKVVINNFVNEDLSIKPKSYLLYFERCLNAVDTSSTSSMRQYCTIPQILYYITDAVVSYKRSIGGCDKHEN